MGGGVFPFTIMSQGQLVSSAWIRSIASIWRFFFFVPGDVLAVERHPEIDGVEIVCSAI